MICTCFGKTLDLSLIRATANAMLGVPDYDAYLTHFARTHPERDALSREDFLGSGRRAVRLGAAVLLRLVGVEARESKARGKGGKVFFSEEKNQKTFICSARHREPLLSAVAIRSDTAKLRD